MDKIDCKKEFKDLYHPSSKKVALVNVPAFNFVMVDGVGDPNTSLDYKDAVSALFTVSFTLKFMIKKSKEAVDYSVMPLEGLWWADDAKSFVAGNKDLWKWTSMILQPKFVTEAMFKEAIEQTNKKKNLPALPKVRFECFHEGLSAQILHLGPYSAEKTTVEKIHGFIKEGGYKLYGKHHEIYLSNPGKVAPEKLKTIVRQPMKKEN
jgi:hypothetical protein